MTTQQAKTSQRLLAESGNARPPLPPHTNSPQLPEQGERGKRRRSTCAREVSDAGPGGLSKSAALGHLASVSSLTRYCYGC